MADTTIDDEPVATARAMTSSNQSGNRGHGETPIANINYRIYRPFPSTNQVLMVYRNAGTLNVGTTGADRVQALTFRLNSINDIVTTKTYSSNPNVSTSDTIDAAANVPSMRNFWSTVYQYYTVVRSRYMFRIRPNNQATPHALDSVDIYQHMHGVQAPPTLDPTSEPIPWQYKKYFPQTVMKKLLMQPKTLANTENHWLNNFTTFYGQWYPGTIKHEIEEDEVQKTWIKIGATPPLGEFLTYHIQRASESNTSGSLAFSYEFAIELEVQLKELTSQYQFIRPNTTLNMIPAPIDQNNVPGSLAPTTAQVFNIIN